MSLFDRAFPGESENPDDGGNEDSLAMSADERKLADAVKSDIDRVRMSSNRIAQEGVWMTNTAYLKGFDAVRYDTVTRSFKNTGRPNSLLRKHRVKVNKILPACQNRLARLAKNPPRYDVRPESSDTQDKEAARLGVQIIDMHWQRERINEKRLHLYMWLQQCGHAYIKISWDTDAGEPMVDPETNELSYQGDIRVDVCSPFEIFADPLAKTFDDATWLTQAKVRKLDYFKARYPRGHMVKEEGPWLLSAQYEQRINSMTTQSNGQSAAQQQMKDAAIEITKYEKRSVKHPMGRMITVANGILLDDKPLPVGEIPFAKFDDIIVAGSYYPEAVITHLRPLQDQKNRIVSQRSAWTSKLLAGKYLAAKGHGLAPEALNDESGEVVEYTPVPNANPPTAMAVPTMPSYAYKEDEQCDQNFNEISGLNQASQGQAPSPEMPAIGMQLLIEQDDTRLGVTIEQHENSWSRVGKLLLLYTQEFYVMIRKLKISGQSLEYAIKSFVGADIRNNHDVVCIRGSTIPGSKVLKRQEILTLMSTGLLGDPKDPRVIEKVLGALEYGDLPEVWEDHGLDQAQIRRMMDGLEQGIIPELDDGDNAALIAQEINRFRKTQKFDGLQPEIQAAFIHFRQTCIQRLTALMHPELAQQQQQASQMMQQAQGMPDQPPGIDQSGQMPQNGNTPGVQPNGPQPPSPH